MEERTTEMGRRLRMERWALFLKRALLLSIGAAVIAGGWAVYRGYRTILSYLGAGPLFELRDIRVEPSHLALTVAEAGGVSRGMNLLFLDIAGVHERIAALPTVESCTVLKVLPSTLTIRVTERKPWMVVEDGRSGRVFFMDASGVEVPEPVDATGYWRVRGLACPGVHASELRRKISVLKEVEKWYTFYAVGDVFPVFEVDLSSPTCVTLVRADGRKAYVFPDGIRDRMKILRACVEKMTGENVAWEYIDMRFSNPYVGTFHGGTGNNGGGRRKQ